MFSCRFPIRFALLVLLLMAAGSALALPDHGLHHPRLLMSDGELDALRVAIAQDPERDEVWSETRDLTAELVTLTPDSLLSYYWGFQEIEELCLMAQLGEGAEAVAAADAIESALVWLIANQGPAPDPEHGALGSALRLHALVWGYDHAFATAGEAERQAVVDEILIYLQAMSSQNVFLQYAYNPLVSNKCLTVGAQMLLATLLLEEDLPGDPILDEARIVGQTLVDKAWSDLFGVGGGYREGISYMLWSLRTLLPTWEARTRLEGEDPLRASRAQALLEWLAYQMPAAGAGATLNRNDSNSADYLLSRHHSLLEWCSSRGPDPDFARWLLRRASGDLGHDFGHDSDPVATLLWHDSGTEAAPALPDSRLFEDTGLFVHRRGWPGDPLEDSFLLTLEGTTFMGGHAQEDVGQLCFRAMGLGFALDHGAGATAKQTEAHNLPMADGLGQHNAGASIGTDGSLSLLMDAGFCTALQVDMAEAYSGHSPFNDPDVPWAGWDWSWGYDGGNPMSRAERSLLLFPGGPGELPQFFLEDLLVKEEPGPHDFRWRLHLAADLNFYEHGGGQWRAEGETGHLRLQLHDPPRSELSTSVTDFDNGNVESDSRLFVVGQNTDHFRFLWQWTPLRNGDEAPAISTTRLPEGVHILSQRGGRDRRVLRRDGTAPLVAEGDLLDGDWGVIETEAGQTRTLLLAGKRLRREGSLLIGLEPAGSASMAGDTVRISSPELSFKLWAPTAQVVLAGEILVPFRRRGEFISGPDHSDQELPEVAALRPPHSAGRLAGGKPPYRIDFDLDSPAPGRLAIYDLQGRLLRRLTTGPGRPLFAWDGRDEQGSPAASGVYLLRYSAAGGSPLHRKLLLLR
jgi:hypothetical protein